MVRVLIVDDDAKITSLLQRGLAYEGFDVVVAADGVEGLARAATDQPDLMILDVTMPGLSGFEVLKRLRMESDLPVLMLTAREELADKVEGLNEGADDYLGKPFAFDELVARIRAVLRRRQKNEREVLRYADLTLDTKTREVWRARRPLELTAKEFDLLTLFMRHPRQVLTKEVCLERVWGYGFVGESNVLEVYVGYLRQKLEAEGEPRLIHTIRGAGYALRG